nr:(E)-beta-farnesene synthase-like [Tanacetum cinerariifolium]
MAFKESLEATVKLNYGTYEELEIFAQAVERWSISCLDMLPEYMKLIYQELVKARWLKEGYMPTVEEYMSVSMVTGTYGLMIARSYVGRGDIVTEDTFKWVSSGATEEEACEYISRKVKDAWKVINRESLRPTAVPFPLLMPATNLARMREVLYSVDDGFTHAGEEMISYMKAYFVHPMGI